MNKNSFSLPWLGLMAMLLISGCTTEAWYQGVHQGAENECRLKPGAAADECLARLNRKPYQEYEKERSSSR